MEIRDLLELLYTARKRFTTIQLAWQYWVHVEAMNDALQRWASRQPSGSVAPLATGGGQRGQKEMRIRWQIWWRKPACWRDEQTVEGPGKLSRIICDGRFYSFNSESGKLFTNDMKQKEFAHVRVDKVTGSLDHHVHRLTDAVNDMPPLVDPTFLLASHDLEPIAHTTHAGRDAVRVRAVCRPGKKTVRDSFFWGAADEYDLLVDVERGILLRYAAQVNGDAFAVATVENVLFDEPIPDDVFSFIPPPKTTVQIVA